MGNHKLNCFKWGLDLGYLGIDIADFHKSSIKNQNQACEKEEW